MGACPRTTYCHVLGDDVNDYEALKADLKKMFILLKSEMSLHAVLSPESATWRTSRRFCYQSPRGGREGPKYQTVLMAVLEKEPTTMDEARRITLKTILIEEASYSMDFRNNYPYDRRMEELTAALNCPLTLTGDSCVEGATKPSLSEDTYQRKHQATIEARLEKLEECCMRPVGNRTTRERLQPLRFLDGSSRKADDPLALATDVVIDDTPIIQGKIRGFSIQFFFHSEAAISTISKELDINDQDDIGLTNLLMTYDDRQEGRGLNAREAVSVPVLKTPATIRGRRISRFFGNSGHELHHVGEKSLNMVKPTKLIIWVEIARRHGPHGEMRYGDTIHIAVNVTTTVITTRTREKIAGLLRQYVETTSLSDSDLGRSSVIKHRLRKFVESVKPIKKALSRLPIRQEETE
ncbi:hypothetical protein T03_13442 [Trichinella britovi]|uniref:Uncharacterized protein n=1 Tax=Trichinella britovi TaxID=45882 RepID=A0A0V1CRU2_TRIBR|nr:hypothetical protein T03_13442 [Trichinella britovi]